MEHRLMGISLPLTGYIAESKAYPDRSAASFAVPAAVLTVSNAQAQQPEAQQPSERCLMQMLGRLKQALTDLREGMWHTADGARPMQDARKRLCLTKLATNICFGGTKESWRVPS